MSYIILVNDDNSLYGSQKKRIMQRSRDIDTLTFVVNHLYNSIDMTSATVMLEYLLPVSIYQDERPIVVCNDGFRLSIQASKYHLCTPLKNNRTDYTTFELSMLSEEIPELEEFKIYDNGPLNRFDTQTYGFVPREIVEEILEEHGGINKELTLKPMKLDGIRLQTRGLEHVNNYLDGIEMDVQILE